MELFFLTSFLDAQVIETVNFAKQNIPCLFRKKLGQIRGYPQEAIPFPMGQHPEVVKWTFRKMSTCPERESHLSLFRRRPIQGSKKERRFQNILIKYSHEQLLRNQSSIRH